MGSPALAGTCSGMFRGWVIGAASGLLAQCLLPALDSETHLGLPLRSLNLGTSPFSWCTFVSGNGPQTFSRGSLFFFLESGFLQVRVTLCCQGGSVQSTELHVPPDPQLLAELCPETERSSLPSPSGSEWS